MAKKIHRIAYMVPNREGARWVKVGVSFENKDGSETVLLDAIPGNGKLVLQPPKSHEDAEDHLSE